MEPPYEVRWKYWLIAKQAGGLQDLDHTHLVRTITRYARTVREPALDLAELDEAIVTQGARS